MSSHQYHGYTLDTFLPQMESKDPTVAIKLIEYLQLPNVNLNCRELGKFVGHLITWVNASNYKTCINGIQVIQWAIFRSTEQMRTYTAQSKYFHL